MDESKNDIYFDKKLFGLLIRRERQDQGYRTVEDFATAIESKTGWMISPRTLMRIESGSQEAKQGQFLAIILTLYERIPNLGDVNLDPVLTSCCKEWQAIENDYQSRLYAGHAMGLEVPLPKGWKVSDVYPD